MEPGKKTFARATIFYKGKDEHPDRKWGKGFGTNRKFTREATQIPITYPSKIVTEK